MNDVSNIPRVLATEKCVELIQTLSVKHGDLIFHQSGGCCDGSQPMCFPVNEFKIGFSDVMLGTLSGFEFWMSKDQFEYWKHTQLEIDVIDGRGSSFSLEIPYGKRFIVKSRLFDESELDRLTPIKVRED